MDAHEHEMTDAIESRERDLEVLFDLLNGEDVDATDDELSALGVDADDREESAREAMDGLVLAADTRTTLAVTLAVGGPTVKMTAAVERSGHGGWERVSSVDFFDSWAVPREMALDDSSPLVTLFDQQVERLGE